MKISKPLLKLYKISTKCNERQSSWNACKSWFCRPASETLSFDRIETTISSNFSHMEFYKIWFDLNSTFIDLTTRRSVCVIQKRKELSWPYHANRNYQFGDIIVVQCNVQGNSWTLFLQFYLRKVIYNSFCHGIQLY